MKVYINRAIHRGPYGGGNLWVKAAYEFSQKLGHEVLAPDDFKARPDVIFLAGLDADGGISAEQAIMYKMYMGNVKLILRVNENDARKATTGVDQRWISLSEHVDGTVFVSNWLKKYFEDKGWKCPINTVIHNGVDKEIFKPQSKINNGKINLVSHHWSDNAMKGFDIYEEIDKYVKDSDKFTFTYIGRHRNTFKNTNIVAPLYGEKLGAELGKYDVYVSASRWDPGPNHVAEAISCELPTYIHHDGGGGVEFAGSDHSYADWEQLRSLLESEKFKPNTTTFSSWDTCVQRYLDFAKQL
jgi:glycosyltransferase involved in cell wall biosynthesis